MKLSDTQLLILSSASQRTDRAAGLPAKPQRQRRKEGGRQALERKAPAGTSRQGRHAHMAAWRRQQALFIADYQGRP